MFDWQIYPTTPPEGLELVVWRSNGHRIVATYAEGHWRWDIGMGLYLHTKALNGEHWSLIPPLPEPEPAPEDDPDMQSYLERVRGQ